MEVGLWRDYRRRSGVVMWTQAAASQEGREVKIGSILSLTISALALCIAHTKWLQALALG